MELQRGVCSLCSENTRVLTSSDAEKFSKFLPELLTEKILPETEFQTIKNFLKICTICCYKIQIATEAKHFINGTGLKQDDVNDSACYFCKKDENLMKIVKEWKFFTDRTEGLVSFSDFPLHACPQCLFYFDTIFTIRTKLTYKFPQLAALKKKQQSRDTSQKQIDTPKRKSLSKSPPSSKKRKIFDNCFTYLQPLSTDEYHVDDKLKEDLRLYKKIAYVNLKNFKDINLKETPKMRPVIKIKLKPKNKRGKLSKSEELLNKSGRTKLKDRRFSHGANKESSEEPEEEKLDDTPKVASTANLVPNRRVSVYLEDEEKSESSKEPDSEEMNKIDDKYAETPETNEQEKDKNNQEKETNNQEKEKDNQEKEKTNEENEKINQEKEKNNQEKEKNNEENEEINQEQEKSGDVDKNGIEESKLEDKENEPAETHELANGDHTQSLKTTDDSQKNVSEDTSLITLSEELKTLSKSESSEGSDSDTSDKYMNKTNPESDSLTGSERKKKRVTFSDEVVE